MPPSPHEEENRLQDTNFPRARGGEKGEDHAHARLGEERLPRGGSSFSSPPLAFPFSCPAPFNWVPDSARERAPLRRLYAPLPSSPKTDTCCLTLRAKCFFCPWLPFTRKRHQFSVGLGGSLPSFLAPNQGDDLPLPIGTLQMQRSLLALGRAQNFPQLSTSVVFPFSYLDPSSLHQLPLQPSATSHCWKMLFLYRK